MAKLFVIFAAQSPTAAIFRRGPSKWQHVIKWRTDDDSFEHGAWFKGRIYPEKCDLSPDGELLLYFVLKGSRSGTEFTHAWTAVSRLPWLAALALWPQGTTYGGGGRFVNERTIQLRADFDQPHKDFPPRGLRFAYGDPPHHGSSGEIADADWCGQDCDGRVVFARAGQLFRLKANYTEELIADFTNMTPDPKPAPEWAARPLVSGDSSWYKR